MKNKNSKAVVFLAIILLLSLLCSCEGMGGDTDESTAISDVKKYVLNIESKKIHTVSCGTGARISAPKRRIYEGNIYTLLDQGYTRCGLCCPR